MGQVIRFPETTNAPDRPAPLEPALVINLPVIRMPCMEEFMQPRPPTILVLDPVEFLKP